MASSEGRGHRFAPTSVARTGRRPILSGAPIFSGSVPVTWFTLCSGHIVNTLCGINGRINCIAAAISPADMFDHCGYGTASIDETNDDVRVRCCKDSKYLVCKSLPEVLNVTHVQLDFGELVEVV